MSDPKSTKRPAPISYRPPAALQGELYARLLKSGLSMNAFITKAIFDGPAPRQSRRPGVEAGKLARLLAQAALIRDRLDEIAKDSGDASAADPQPQSGPDHNGCKGGQDIAPIIAAAQQDLAILRTAILAAMGRAP